MTRAKKPAASSPATLDTVSASVLELLVMGVDALHVELKTIVESKDDKNAKYDKASRIAFVLSKAGPVGDTIRKMQAAEQKRVTALTLQQIVAWLRANPEDRARVAREISQMDGRRGGVLG